MITLKTPEEIDKIRTGGDILKRVFEEILPLVKAGVTTSSIDKQAERRIIQYGGEPGFKRVKNYHWTTCICVNDQIVHTPPSERVFQDKDVATIDMGVYYGGFHTDSARTVTIGAVSTEVRDFLNAGQVALELAKKQAKAGNHIGHISKALYDHITGQGYFIIKELTGHGVGRELHEDPLIPAFKDGPIEDSPLIRPGMVLAIEVIYCMKKDKMTNEDRTGWSLITKNGSLAACFEDTVAIYENKTVILT